MEKELKNNEADIENVSAEISQQKRKIEEIKNLNNGDVWGKISTITTQELSVIYNNYQERVTYYKITSMKGFFKVYFKGGKEYTIAIDKHNKTRKAYILPDKWEADLESGDIVAYIDNDDFSNMNFKFSPDKRVEINLKKFFKS